MPLLYYITDRTAFPGGDAEQRAAVLRRIAEAANAGVDYIQLREKDLSARTLEGLACEAMRAVRDNSVHTKLLINSRTDIALACGADGVHLPGDDLPATEVRSIWMRCSSRPPLIGVSAHSIADVRLAELHGATFVVLAPIFEKPQTTGPALGSEMLREACLGRRRGPDGERFSVLALGGVTLANAGDCLAAGASGVAGIRLFQAGQVQETIRELRSLPSALYEAVD